MMVKKRVHELAKDFGLDNREIIQRLQQGGLSVKTHSSSVQEDEARAILGGATEPEAPEPSRRPGMMIVRKSKKVEEDAEASTMAEAEAQAVGSEQEAAEVLDGPQKAEAEAEAEAKAEGPGETAAEEAADLQEVAGGPERQTPLQDAEPAETQVKLRAEKSEPAQEESEVEQVAADASEKPIEAKQLEGGDKKKDEAKANKPIKKSTGGATVVGRIDREKLMERVPARRLGGRSSAAAPSQKFGQVTELRVVQDPFGRGREMITVGKDKKGKTGRKKSRVPTKREMMEFRERSMHPARLRRKKTIKRAGKKTELTQPKASKRVVKMKETISVVDLAQQLGVKVGELVRKLMSMGAMTSQNEAVDFDTAQLLASEYDYTVDSIAFDEEEVLSGSLEKEDPAQLQPRPPVVTVMGHVDHGKTSLLDYIRKSRVAAGEAGGITQHIGAYQVEVPKRGNVTFLDTPGHAAFTAMRARGAQATDIVVLVVAADDGVMPQTEEAIRHAQAAEVSIIVAVNKMDRPDANAERVTQQLTQFELVPEAWGGETLFVQTSATKGTGIDELLDAILLQADVLELQANPDRAAVGMVIEAHLDKGRGPVATLLIEKGTLKRGDHVVVGEIIGKVRAMTDASGKQLKEAGPSAAVELVGLTSVPDAGDLLNAVESSDQARDVAAHRTGQKRGQDQSSRSRMSLDDLMARMRGEEAVELKVVLKADVQGSVEAVRESLLKLSTDEVKVKVLYGGVGAIKESDIALASAGGGLVLGFGVRPDTNARQVAEREGVEIRTYTIIYEMIDDIRKAMEGLLGTESQETIVGRAEVRNTFRISKLGLVAGCRVVEGKAMRNAKIRVLRDSVEVYSGRVASLRHFKDDVREVESGLECGTSVEGFNDVKIGDVLEFFQVEEIARTLESSTKRPRRPSGQPEAHP